MRLYYVRYDYMSGIFSVNGHMDYCSYAVAVYRLHAEAFHQLVVSGGHLNSVDFGNNAVSAYLLTSETRLLSIVFP